LVFYAVTLAGIHKDCLDRFAENPTVFEKVSSVIHFCLWTVYG